MVRWRQVGLFTPALTVADEIREKRGMPWRKRYDPALSMEEKGQRAYEVSSLSSCPQVAD